MALNDGGLGAADQFGNDSRVEAMWAMKAMEHAEVYFNILCSVEPSQIPRLTSGDDDEIYSSFRREFPEMDVGKLDEVRDLKSEGRKAQWRGFCENFKSVKDYNFATLLRLDSSDDYSESNTVLVTKVQFFAIELARNREGHNDSVRHKFKPTPRSSSSSSSRQAGPQSSVFVGGMDIRGVEQELQQILSGSHPALQS